MIQTQIETSEGSPVGVLGLRHEAHFEAPSEVPGPISFAPEPVLYGDGLGGAGYPLALAVLATVLLVLALMCGCSTVEERHDHLIRAGKVLVRHWGEADWVSRRDTWLAAAEIECPDAPEAGK